MERLPFVKLEDLVMLTEEDFGELVEVYLLAHPDMKGQVVYDDKVLKDKAMKLISFASSPTMGSA
jgi:hypothetical protein